MHTPPVPRDELLAPGWPVVAARCALDAVPVPGAAAVTHSYAALAFYVGGRARFQQRGGDWELKPGDALLVPAGQAHRLLEAHRPEFWGLGFCAPCFTAHGETSFLEPFERVRDGAAAVIHIPARRHALLETLFGELAASGRPRPGGAPTRLAVQRSLLTLILDEVDAAAAPPRVGAAPSVVTDSLRFIERNALRRLTLGEIAGAVGRSPAYVTTALSRATGRSATAWILSARMAEARRLLLHSDELVDVIAERVGYADPTHFIRMFRREHGATPAAWRLARAAQDRALATR